MRRAIPLLLTCILLSGCAPLEGRYRVAARLDPGASARLDGGGSVAVVIDPDLPETGYKWELAQEIGSAMKRRGFRIASIENADLLVFFGFGTRTDVRRTNPKSLWRSSIRKVYDHWFRIVVSDGDAYRKAGVASVLWAGETVLAEQLTEVPAGDEEHLVEILGRMCRKTVAAFGEQKRPRSISFQRDATP